MRFLEAQQAELVGPRNDPEYLKALVARDRERENAANEITNVFTWWNGAGTTWP
jgi:hypothetical protein